MARSRRCLALAALLATCAAVAHAAPRPEDTFAAGKPIRTYREGLVQVTHGDGALLTLTLDAAALAARADAAGDALVIEDDDTKRSARGVSPGKTDATPRVATDGAPAGLAEEMELPEETGFHHATVSYTHDAVMVSLHRKAETDDVAAEADVQSGATRLASLGVLVALAGSLAAMAC